MVSTDWRWRLEEDIESKVQTETQDMISGGGDMKAREYRHKSGFVMGLQWVLALMQELDRRKE